jgi:gallate dioxygenase
MISEPSLYASANVAISTLRREFKLLRLIGGANRHKRVGQQMATIVGGIASSHTPVIGYAFDKKKQQDRVWGPIFDGFAPVQSWLAKVKPDVLFFVYNDHATSFFFDHYSHFSLGIGERYCPADEGGGPRALPCIDGHPALARHVALGLVADEFDLSFFQKRGLDHGCLSPLSMLWPHDGGWPGAIVPFQVGVLQLPIPSARRCFALGRSLRRAILSFPDDLKVAIVGTGGLSHQVHGERAGFNNTAWDKEFLDTLEHEPEALTNITIADYAHRGGFEGTEVIMWLIMRGALTRKVKKIHQSYYLPSMTPIATVVYEDYGADPAQESNEQYTTRIQKQWVGLDQLKGTYPFTIEKAVSRYRINEFLHRLIDPHERQRFHQDAERCFEEAKLTDEERALIRNRDWRGLIQYGVLFFLLEKLGAVVGAPNPELYAAMRGESLEDFQKTRNSQVSYSVAGESK